MNMILTSSQSVDQDVRLYAIQCLVRTAEFYYEFLSPYLEPIWRVRGFSS